MRACFSWFSKAFAVVFCSHVSSMLCSGRLSFKGGGGGVWKSFILISMNYFNSFKIVLLWEGNKVA